MPLPRLLRDAHTMKHNSTWRPIFSKPLLLLLNNECRTESHRTKSHRQKVTDEKSQDKKSQFKFCILTKRTGQKLTTYNFA